MKRLLCAIAVLWLFLLILSPINAAAQRIRPPTDEELNQQSAEAERKRQERATLETLKRKDKDHGAQPIDESFYNRKLTEAQKKLITPLAEDEAACREFLRQDHTGLIRLLPRGKYEFGVTVAINRDPDLVLPIRGGGAFYSFVEKKHSLGPWSEITLEEGRLIAGFLEESIGLMTMLGDVPLESVTTATPGVAYLSQLAPPEALADLTQQRNRNFQGFKIDNHLYHSNLLALVNQTYALRSVVYKREGRMQLGATGTVYVPDPQEYKGADELIVFRIIRLSDDGSLTILWKRLQKFSPPRTRQK